MTLQLSLRHLRFHQQLLDGALFLFAGRTRACQRASYFVADAVSILD